MTARTPTYLKALFENGDIPQQADYGDIFDSFLPITATGRQVLDISLAIGGDFSASGDVYGKDFYGNNANFISVSASSFNTNQINSQIVSASIVNTNKINAQVVSASSAIFDRVNANVVSASVGEFNVINAQVVSASSANIRYFRASVTASVAATAAVTASAKILTEAISVIKSVTSGSSDAFILERSRPGFIQRIITDVSASAKLYPTSASKFNNQANGAPFDLLDRKVIEIYHITSAQYYTATLNR